MVSSRLNDRMMTRTIYRVGETERTSTIRDEKRMRGGRKIGVGEHLQRSAQFFDSSVRLDSPLKEEQR